MAEKDNQVDQYKQGTVDELINDMQILQTESNDQFTVISPEARRKVEVHFVPSAGGSEIIGDVEKWSDSGVLWIKELHSDKSRFLPNDAHVKSLIIKLED